MLVCPSAKLVEGDDARLMILGEGSLRDEVVTLAYQHIMPDFNVDAAPFYDQHLALLFPSK